jgi:diguanylate cyclase (GGDEF)-like protein
VLLDDAVTVANREGDSRERIDVFLARLGRGFCADRAFVFEINGRGTYQNTFEWCATGVPSQRADLQDMSESIYRPDIWNALRAGEAYAVSDINAFRAHDPAVARDFAGESFNTFIIAPITVAGELCGFVGVNHPAPAVFRDGALLMKQAALILSAEFERRGHWTNYCAVPTRDRLTGLLNVRGMSDAVDAAIRAAREGSSAAPKAVVFLDIADFKSFNRIRGYDRGDWLLTRLGALLEEEAGEGCACRTEADHFYALVEDDRAEALVDVVHAKMREEQDYRVNVTGGIYTIDGSETSTSQALDRAKIAKGTVREDFHNCWRRYSGQMETSLAVENYVATHVREAVAKGWVKVYLQPMVGTFSGKVEEFEALARWDDPTHGMLPPAAFVDVLEHTRQAYLLDLAILDQVCAIIEEKRREFAPFVPVSVNLSRFDLDLPDIHERIDAILGAHRVPHRLIRIEITETALVDNEDLIARHLRIFHERGYEVWLDDFGSGYSSLNTLQRFDFDCVKLDMLFLRSESGKSRMLVGDLVEMAKHLGLKTLAEGVETEDQFRFLKEVGCSLAQGYWCARPLPLAQAERNLSRKGFSYLAAPARLLFDDIARVDVQGGLAPYGPEDGFQNGRDEAVAVIVERDGSLGTVYANRALKTYLNVSDALQIDRRLAGDSSVAWHLRAGLRASEGMGKGRTFIDVWDDKEIAVRMRCVSDRPYGRAYLIRARVVSSGGVASSEDLFGVVSPLIATIDVVDLASGRIVTWYSANGISDGERGPRSYPEEIDRIAQSLIYPSDVEAFRAFADPATVAQRVDGASKGILSGFFRLRVEEGVYELRRVVLCRTPLSSSVDGFLLCVMTDAAGLTQAALEQSRLATPVQAGNLSAEELWTASLSSATSGVFWKDADRRFLGANSTFLRYYNLELSDILGKNDEDMGWHPDSEPFKHDELDVLQHGTVVSNVVGTCLVGDEVHSIMATKAPVYRGDRIVGLLGRFFDVSNMIDALDNVGIEELKPLRNQAYIDSITGLPNANGIHRVCVQRERAFARTREDFGLAVVQLLGAHRFLDDYGTEAFDELQRAVAGALQTLGPDVTVGRSYPTRYAMVVSPCDAKRLGEVCDAVESVLGAITQVAGAPCTVYAMVGTALYSESEDIGEMTAYAEARFAPAGRASASQAAGLRAGGDLRTANESLRRENAVLMPRVAHRCALRACSTRRGFDEKAERLFLSGADDVALVAVDIDNFKVFNDRFGHHVGDAALESLAGELQNLFGKPYVSRFGGDEFQAIMIDPDDDAMARIADFFSREHAFEADGETYRYRCCAGYVRRSGSRESFVELCRKADVALYHAKLARGGAFEYNDGMRSDARTMIGFSLDDIVEGIPAALLVFKDDASEEIVFANGLCADLFGCDSIEGFMSYCGGSFRAIVAPDDRDRVETVIRAQRSGGSRSSRDFVSFHIVRADGVRVRVLDAGRWVTNGSYGNVRFALLISAEMVEGWDK